MIDWLSLWQVLALSIAWIVVSIFLISGIEDLVYDVGLYVWKIIKKLRFQSRPRLTLQRLRSRVQQRIAVFIPAWNEADVIIKMVGNLIETVDYRNFYIFVGAYPNDQATLQAVDQIASKYNNVIKVINGTPGPTTKADCLNAVYSAMREYEVKEELNFDIIVMHDAEDVVHPYSLLLYNYLLPRVDAVQLPILPLPVPHHKVVHWSYADEFAENHMKDMVVREHINGLVPFAGVGTGFSRRAFLMLDEEGHGKMFNEFTLTEDYNFSKKLNDLGLKTIFVNVVLADEKESFFTPLSRRRGFISNWSYFPQTFIRAVRQKTRWVLGITLQEWELSGWSGTPLVKLSLIKDRKTFITSMAAILAYVVLAYVILAELGKHGMIPFTLLPIIFKGTLLYYLVLVATGIMLIRIVERIIFVSMVYGIVAGLLSLPRLIFGNVLNGIATFRALTQYLAARRNKRSVAWDKTEHHEGVGRIPSNSPGTNLPLKNRNTFSLDRLKKMVIEIDTLGIISEIELIPKDLNVNDRVHTLEILKDLASWDDYRVRAAIARIGGFLRWEKLYPLLLNLLRDPEWLIRANSARALLNFPTINATIEDVLELDDRFAQEVFIRTLEQYTPAHEEIIKMMANSEMQEIGVRLLKKSPLLRKRLDRKL